MGGGSSKEKHDAKIQTLNEQWQRATEEERKKARELMANQNLKFDDLLKIAKRDQFFSELRRKENIELREEISGLKLKLAIAPLTELVNKLAIVGKDDVEDDRCSVAKVWN